MIRYALLIVVLLILGCLIMVNVNRHDAFVGAPPKHSKPYNILDYTKPAAKP